MLQQSISSLRKFVRKDRDFFLCWLLMGLVLHLIGFSLYTVLRQLGLLTYDRSNSFVRIIDTLLRYGLWYAFVAASGFCSWVLLTARLGRIQSWLWVSLAAPLVLWLFDRSINLEEAPYSVRLFYWMLYVLLTYAPYALVLAKYSSRAWALVLSGLIMYSLRWVITDTGKDISPLWSMVSYNIAEITLVVLASLTMTWIVQNARVTEPHATDAKPVIALASETHLHTDGHMGEHI